DRAEVAVLVGPLVPDRDAVVAQVLRVRVAADEPQQLGHDALEVDLLGGDDGEPLSQVEPHLVPEDTARSGAGAVTLGDPLVEDPADELEVGLHVRRLATRPARRRTRRERLARVTEPLATTPADVKRFVALQLGVTVVFAVIVVVVFGPDGDPGARWWAALALIALVLGASALVSRWWSDATS